MSPQGAKLSYAVLSHFVADVLATQLRGSEVENHSGEVRFDERTKEANGFHEKKESKIRFY